jgi:hypothetical protein
MRQHTSAYVSIRQDVYAVARHDDTTIIGSAPAYVSIRQHTAAYVRLCMQQLNTTTPQEAHLIISLLLRQYLYSCMSFTGEHRRRLRLVGARQYVYFCSSKASVSICTFFY